MRHGAPCVCRFASVGACALASPCASVRSPCASVRSPCASVRFGVRVGHGWRVSSVRRVRERVGASVGRRECARRRRVGVGACAVRVACLTLAVRHGSPTGWLVAVCARRRVAVRVRHGTPCRACAPCVCATPSLRRAVRVGALAVRVGTPCVCGSVRHGVGVGACVSPLVGVAVRVAVGRCRRVGASVRRLVGASVGRCVGVAVSAVRVACLTLAVRHGSPTGWIVAVCARRRVAVRLSGCARRVGAPCVCVSVRWRVGACRCRCVSVSVRSPCARRCVRRALVGALVGA